MTYSLSYKAEGRLGEVLIQNHSGTFMVVWSDPNNKNHIKEKNFHDWNEARRFAKQRRLSEEFIMWFDDGQGRTYISGKKELNEYAKRFNFDADEVWRHGQTKMLDDDGDVIGGVITDGF